jgi:TonB family protein
MITLLVYIFKAALYLAAFYLLYTILLSRDTSYGRNRAFILLSMAGAFILPLFTVHTGKYFNIELFGKWLSEILVTSDSNETVTPGSGIKLISKLQLIFTIYICVVIVFISRLIIDLANLLVLIILRKKEDGRIIRFQSYNTAGFSALGYIFINTRLSSEEETDIIIHEQNHLHKNHFLDIVFIELVKAFQWFNPAVYMFNRSLRAIHEYQADLECLSSGISVGNYQRLLMNQVFRTRAFNLTNSFSNPSLIKKRMIMMSKKRTSALSDIKLLFVLPFIGLVFFVISANGRSADFKTSITNPGNFPQASDPTAIMPDGSTESVPFGMVEEMPEFPGGDAELLKYIAQNTVYPENAKKNNIQGRVNIRFCITETGRVNRISVLKGVNPALDTEAVRVVGSLPPFKPGKQGGKAVPVWYMIPITFTLR